ncbi:hypothetical protein [Cytobacillus purgationiresistens]|uniref:Uncharacterized protein n=1 Tax=Cytobacillus purgationiresistens TaxID=863449 RepID=A0ABU0AQG7_9BACI|nr:hypothetical protein [Cytobacillus purgationiresistens]MDQ0273509.1 hypothetical protein [Cytobacillus purgationiresistens]
MSQIDTTYNTVYNHLLEKFNNDIDFQNEIQYLIHFYGKKLMNFTKNDEQKLLVEVSSEKLIKSQFFQGYFIMKTILEDDQMELGEKIWTVNPGIIRNELPILLEQTYSNSVEDWYKTDVGHQVSFELIQVFSDVFDLVKQIRKDISIYGCYKAVIEDPRYSGFNETSEHQFLLGDPMDLDFLNPQVYMQAEFITEEQEFWDLYNWSSSQNSVSKWIGSIQLSSIPQDNDSFFYLIQFTLSNTILEEEKQGIIQKVHKRLPQDVLSTLQIRYYSASELNVVIPQNA